MVERSVFEDAAKSRNTVRISYTDKKGEATTRNVEPYEIRGNTLWAYCRKKKGIRQFDMSRISKAKPTKNLYIPKWDIKMSEGQEKIACFYTNGLKDMLFGEYEKAPLE